MRNMSKLRGFAITFIPLVLCVSLLIGFTLAWFTDEAVNNDNNIEAGTLKVEMLKCDPTGLTYTAVEDGKLFDNSYWEPGTTKIVYLAVKNEGTLNLQYNLQLTVDEGAVPLSEVLEYAVIAPMTKKDSSGLTEWSQIIAKSGVKTGTLQKGQNILESDTVLKTGATKYFMMAIHMKEDADRKSVV